MKLKSGLQVIAIAFGVVLIAIAILYIAELGLSETASEITKAKACPLAVNWIGCALSNHDSLAGGLVGGGFTLLAAAIAYRAVHDQINAERDLREKDRIDAERYLVTKLSEDAEELGVIWRILDDLNKKEKTLSSDRVAGAARWIISNIANKDLTNMYRQMVSTFVWEKRMAFSHLIDGLESLNEVAQENDDEYCSELLYLIRNVTREFENCIPQSEKHFEGLWRRTPKAMERADLIKYYAGAVDD